MRSAPFLLLLAACAGVPVDDIIDTDVEPAIDPWSWPVDESGPYQAGFRSWDHTYDPVSGATPESRTVRLNLWYPTDDTGGEAANYSDLFTDEEAFTDATLAAAVHDGGYPVLVHSHGDQAWGGSAAYLFRWFASHGWVVVAPDHTDNVFLSNADPTPQGHWYHRPRDITAMLDALEDLPSDDPLSGLAQTDQAVMSGHSRGVYTVWSIAGATYGEDEPERLCPGCDADQLALFDDGLSDPRVVATIPMAGQIPRSSFGDTGHQSVSIPVLAMTGSEDGGGQDQFDTMDQVDFTWIDLEGGCHETFNIGACGTLDPELGFSIVQTYALAFARAQLGDTSVSGILDGTEEVSDVVSYAHRSE